MSSRPSVRHAQVETLRDAISCKSFDKAAFDGKLGIRATSEILYVSVNPKVRRVMEAK